MVILVIEMYGLEKKSNFEFIGRNSHVTTHVQLSRTIEIDTETRTESQEYTRLVVKPKDILSKYLSL